MKKQIILSILLTGIIIFFFNACNSDNSTNPIDNQSVSSSELSQAELLDKLAYGQTLLLEAKQTDRSIFDAATKELKSNWKEFNSQTTTANSQSKNLLERIEILEKYFPAIANYTSSKSNTNHSYNYITDSCDDGRCQVCGFIYFHEEGDSDRGIPRGTRFYDLVMIYPDWTCPICDAGIWDFECFDL